MAEGSRRAARGPLGIVSGALEAEIDLVTKLFELGTSVPGA